MSNQAKREYLAEIRKRYVSSSKIEKGQILNEFCSVCDYNRKYAIRLINSPNVPKATHKRPGRKNKYHQEAIAEFLRSLWIKTNLICSSRLKAAIALWLPFYPKVLTAEQQKLLLCISASTIDRILSASRKKYHKRFGLSTTRPGSLLKKQIPIKTNQWDEFHPGFVEADTVAHCGTTISGQYVHTVQVVDIATTWTEARASWGKGEQGVFAALKEIENSLPFKILGFDSDNGNEFLNRNLLKYFLNKKPPVSFTRSREYHKNDNAHIEEKNWTNIRQYLGYARFDNPLITPLLNDLFANEWTLFFNFFVPSVKLIAKERIGSKIIKKHDIPKTPFQRLIESDFIKPKTKKHWSLIAGSLNPFLLQASVANKIKNIQSLAHDF